MPNPYLKAPVSIGQRLIATHGNTASGVSTGALEKKARGSVRSRFCLWISPSSSARPAG
jgi:hypothetical protein